MSTPGYYRDEAVRCRARAAKSGDADAIKRWLQMAAEYEPLAEGMASGRPGRRSPTERRRCNACPCSSRKSSSNSRLRRNLTKKDEPSLGKMVQGCVRDNPGCRHSASQDALWLIRATLVEQAKGQARAADRDNAS